MLKLLGYDLNKEKVTVRNVICPDGAHQCPDGDTCCSIGGDNYNFGCCPKPNAECCADMKHCCPEGYSCATNECIKDTSSHPLLEVVGRPKEQKVKDITCPDGAHQCPDGDTCCSVGGGNFGCCPKPSAVCCPDMKHCCPGGFSCTTNKCIKDTSSHPLLELIGRPKKQKVRNVFCPGGNQQCPDGDTCCNVGDDIYGCCPKPSAVCCADMKHCCPEGYSCSTNECIKDTSSHPLLEVVGRPKEQKVKDITCPDGAHQCPDGDTCCSVGGGNFGCCPKPSAVCCPDMKHCCPGGFSCTTNKCIKDTSSHPLLELIGRPKKQKVRNVFCPGGNQQCPDGDTCCNVGDDIYGCCPKPSAVCCADMKHCCPEGYSCSTNECIKDGSSHPLLELIGRPKEQEVHKVSCPGGTQQCPDGDTCCSVGGGNFGCCPEPNAVCCDKKNCCPEGYRCLTNGCKKDGSSHPLLEIVSRPQKDIL